MGLLSDLGKGIYASNSAQVFSDLRNIDDRDLLVFKSISYHRGFFLSLASMHDTLNIHEIRALCFDIDGTLRDTDDQMVAQLSHWLLWIRRLFPQQNPQPFARKLIMAMEEPGNMLLKLADLLGFDAKIASLSNFINAHSLVGPKNHTLVPGVLEALRELQSHFPMAIVSARNQQSTTSFLDYFGLNSYFICIIHGQSCSHTKPFPDPIVLAASVMKVPPGSCVMIGDTTVDVHAGIAAGAQTIGVLSGFGKKDELQKSGANLVINSVAELPAVLICG